MKNQNRFKKIEYVDAHYSYKKVNNIPRGKVISFGKIILETPTYIDLEVAWSEDPHCTQFGIVIPKGALFFKKNKIKDFKEKLIPKDVIAIYWEDIFAYDGDYVGPHVPKPMLTEGVFLKEINEYLLIDSPETLNLKEAKNHPEKKPARYLIPKSMITEIKIVKRYENKK